MTNIARIQNEGKLLLQSSGWEQQKINALAECLIDFTSQAFSDEMYKDARLELWEDKNEHTLNIVCKTNHLNVRVELHEHYEAYWDLFAGKIVDGIEVECESSGFGGW